MATVRVRIAVAVVDEEDWHACGWAGADGDDELASLATEALDAAVAAVHFIEADIPLPESVTVEGSVAPKGDE